LTLPDGAHRHATLVDEHEPPRPTTVRARHAASLLVWRKAGGSTEILMGMRGARHRFMPNRLVFPGGAVDRADLSAPFASGLSARTAAALLLTCLIAVIVRAQAPQPAAPREDAAVRAEDANRVRHHRSRRRR